MIIDKLTSFTDVDIVAVSLIIIFLVLLCYVIYDDIKIYRKLRDRVDDLEKQIAHISKTSAEFFCNINNRIVDISTVVDTLDSNVDALFDENINRCQSISSLKQSIDCINCKLQNPLTRFKK